MPPTLVSAPVCDPNVPLVCESRGSYGTVTTPGPVTYERATYIPTGGTNGQPPLVIDCNGGGDSSVEGPLSHLIVDIYAKGITDQAGVLAPKQQLAKLGGVTLKSNFYQGGNLNLIDQTSLTNDGVQNHNLSVTFPNLVANPSSLCGTFEIEIWVGNQEVSAFQFAVSGPGGVMTSGLQPSGQYVSCDLPK